MIGWKYFTLFCDDGTIAAGALGANASDCELWVSVYGRDGLALDRFYPLDRLRLRAEGIEVAGSSLLWSGDVLKLCLREAGLSLDVEARRLVEWRENRVRRMVGSRRVDWEVPGLRMVFSGRLEVGGRARQVSGLMFHDEVWHELRPSLSLLWNMRSWVWGILCSKSFSILFVQVDYRADPFAFGCVSGPRGVALCGDVDFDGRELVLDGERVPVALAERHVVHHGVGLARLWSRWFEPKHHCCGRFTFRGEEGRAYVESLKLR